MRPLPSPLRTPTDAEVAHAIAAAHALGLRVFLAPILDPNWDIVSNMRDTHADTRLNVSWARDGRGYATRAQIGAGFSSETFRRATTPGE